MRNGALPLDKLIIPAVLVLLAVDRDAWRAMATTDPADEVPAHCLEHTVTSGTFDQYFALADIGNAPSDAYGLNVSFTVEVRNRQEELAVLLSGQNRSYQHPDFARTYEMRMTNVYTVVYRETLKMQAYHSPTDKLFPPEADRFRLRFLLSRDGNLTVLVNENRRRPLLAVVDERQALDVQYVSFSSRMNAYPVRFYLGCGLPQYRAVEVVREEAEGSPANLPLTDGSCPVCPVCPKQRCEVVVKACADTSKDGAGNGTPVGAGELEQQKYYFYFNLYLMKNRTRSNVLAGGRKPADEAGP
uniref:Farnesoic acid O-methyl transferase domain-containing protein n=1 Tax=Anopheles epiroticus TaxID=199890 RepID=A0A182PT60_9DIPT